MSDPFTLNPGSGVLTKGFKRYTPNNDLEVSFGKPKGATAFHLFLYLGVYDGNDERRNAGADARLNELGWVYDEKRAEKLNEARRKEEEGA